MSVSAGWSRADLLRRVASALELALEVAQHPLSGGVLGLEGTSPSVAAEMYGDKILTEISMLLLAAARLRMLAPRIESLVDATADRKSVV